MFRVFSAFQLSPSSDTLSVAGGFGPPSQDVGPITEVRQTSTTAFAPDLCEQLACHPPLPPQHNPLELPFAQWRTDRCSTFPRFRRCQCTVYRTDRIKSMPGPIRSMPPHDGWSGDATDDTAPVAVAHTRQRYGHQPRDAV